MIYFCIPCHNEERTVGIVLWKIRQVMADYPRDYQILVADDASTDKSYEVLEPYSHVLPLTLLRTSDRRGYAATLEMLLREAVRRSDYPKRDIVVILQADFTDDPEYAVPMLKRLESGADIAVPDSIAPAQHGLLNGLATRFAHRFTNRRAWPPEVKDPFHGFLTIRLLCVQKAFEAQTGRLIAWEGRVGNAALLHAVLPHGRRTDAVEITTHSERLQRASRFAPLEALRNAWRFGRGIPTGGILAVERLSPDQVHGDRAALRTATGNGRAREEDTAVGRSDRGRKRNGDRTRTDDRGERTAGRRSGGRSRQAGDHPGDPGDSSPGGAPESGQRSGQRRDARPESVHGPSARPARSPRPHRERPRAAAETSSQEDNQIPENANAGPGSGTNATGSETVEPTVRTARASRGRRGGRRRNERPTPDAEQDGAPQGLDSEAVTAPTGTSGTDGPEASDGPADNGTDMPRKRRRRGRRGGRRHRGSRGSEAGTLGAPEDSSGPDPGPASAAAGRADAPEENER